MNRYFIAHSEDMPKLEDTEFGTYHFIDLGSHGEAGENFHLIVLCDGWAKPRENWHALPPLFDAKTTLAASTVPHELLADLGLTGDETTMEAVVKLGEINPALGF